MEHKFDEDVVWFTKQVNSRKRLLPNFAHAAALLMQRVDEDLDKFIEQYGYDKEYEDEELESYAIPLEYSGRHRLLRSASIESTIFADLLPRMTLVSLVSVFDAYLAKLVRTLFKVKPAILNSSEKQLTFKQLSDFDSIEDAREYIVECEIESLLRDNHTKQFDWLERKLGIPLKKDLPAWMLFIEITERRNLLVHSDGVVGKQYLSTCKNAGCTIDEDIIAGSRLSIPPNYYDQACSCIAEIGIKLNQVMWRKLLPDDITKADESLVSVSYELLVEENFHLAETILSFAIRPPIKCATEECSLYLKINLAIALKAQDKNDECAKIIESVDWSALADLFKVASCSLSEKYDEAKEIMLRIGPSSHPNKTEYKEWPVFRWFRKTNQFKEAFHQVFNEEYKMIAHITEPKENAEGDTESP